eukprot:scaffold36269_cov66-Phaeocystis_antarctica.AAC.1
MAPHTPGQVRPAAHTCEPRLAQTASAVGNGKAPPPSPERTALLEELRAISAASRRSVGGTAYSSISK